VSPLVMSGIGFQRWREPERPTSADMSTCALAHERGASRVQLRSSRLTAQRRPPSAHQFEGGSKSNDEQPPESASAATARAFFVVIVVLIASFPYCCVCDAWALAPSKIKIV
jgi:hypothetical protein